jgi:hypothetical protein
MTLLFRMVPASCDLHYLKKAGIGCRIPAETASLILKSGVDFRNWHDAMAFMIGKQEDPAVMDTSAISCKRLETCPPCTRPLTLKQKQGQGQEQEQEQARDATRHETLPSQGKRQDTTTLGMDARRGAGAGAGMPWDYHEDLLSRRDRSDHFVASMEGIKRWWICYP